MVLVTKSVAPTIPLSSGTVRFVAISGELHWPDLGVSAPITGSGHMVDQVFHFEVKGSGYSITEAAVYTIAVEMLWNISTRAGGWVMNIGVRDRTGAERAGYLFAGLDLPEVDCSRVELPHW